MVVVRTFFGVGRVGGVLCAAAAWWFGVAAATAAERPNSAAAAPAAVDEEGAYYRLVKLPIPRDVVLEAGAIESLPDRKLAVATRRGEVYEVEGAWTDAPGDGDLRYRRIAAGLHEILGLNYRNGELFAVQRPEVTKLVDEDGDGRADLFQTYASWPISGDYHEYAFGGPIDDEGNMWIVLCLTGSFSSQVPFRGWCLRISPEGKVIPTTSGIRSPGGLGVGADGAVFYTENQGPWNGACSLKHLSPGKFVGHPAGLVWHDAAANMGPKPREPESGGRWAAELKKIPELVPPACWFPYSKMGQSASGIACDRSGGRFGPFAGQLFVGDVTHSKLMRVALEQVNGYYQGACFSFREGFASGVLSLRFDGGDALFVGETNRGWGSRGGEPFALERLTWTGRTPFEIHSMHALPDGFELRFTQPTDPQSAADVASYALQTYTYIYQAAYGSPEVDHTKPTIRRAIPAADGRSVRLIVDGLVPGHIHELHADGVRSAGGAPLLHAEAYYTLNFLPSRD